MAVSRLLFAGHVGIRQFFVPLVKFQVSLGEQRLNDLFCPPQWDFAPLGHVFRAHQFVYSTKHIANREGGDFCNLYAFDL
jgi:hypothetical protein